MRAGEQPERLGVDVALVAQLAQALVRPRDGTAAGERQALELPQPQVRGPLLETRAAPRCRRAGVPPSAGSARPAAGSARRQRRAAARPRWPRAPRTRPAPGRPGTRPPDRLQHLPRARTYLARSVLRDRVPGGQSVCRPRRRATGPTRRRAVRGDRQPESAQHDRPTLCHPSRRDSIVRRRAKEAYTCTDLHRAVRVWSDRVRGTRHVRSRPRRCRANQSTFFVSARGRLPLRP